MKTSVNLEGVELKNPVMTASGTFGSGAEYSEFVDLKELGADVYKRQGQRRAGFGSFRKRKQGKPDRIRKSPFHTYHLLKISNGKISINKKAV